MTGRIVCLALAVLCAGLALTGLLLRERGQGPAVLAAGAYGSADVSPVAVPRGDTDINGGDAEEISRLYRVGETISALIVAEREANGCFFYPEDLLVVHGIGRSTLDGFRDSLDLRVPGPDLP